MTDRLSPSALWRLAGPVVSSRLALMAMGLTDTIVVGRHGSGELAALTLGWAPTAVVLVAGIGFLSGIQVLTAHRVGEGHPEASVSVLRRGVFDAFWAGVLATGLLLALGPALLAGMGIDQSLADRAAAVLALLALSMPLYLAADALLFWMEAHGHARRPMMMLWIANLANLALDLWLVPGGVAGLEGAEAAAWATLGSRGLLMLLLVGVLLGWAPARRWRVWRRAPAVAGEAWAQRRIGLASGASYALEGGAFSAMGLIAGTLGPLQAAAWGVILNVAGLVFMVPLGLGMATSVFVGRAVGAGHAVQAMRAFRLGSGHAGLVLGGVALLLALAPDIVALPYTDDPALLAILVPALALSSLFVVADGLQTVAAQALRAVGEIWWPTFAHLLAYWGVMVPLAWVLAAGHGQGTRGIVMAVIVASLGAAVLTMGRFLAVGPRRARRPA